MSPPLAQVITGGWLGGGCGGPDVGGALGVRLGVFVGVAVALGDGDGDGDGLGDGDMESDGDGESVADGEALGTGIAPNCPLPHVSSPPVTASAVPSRVTEPAATVTSSPATANRAAPAFATDPTRRRSGRNAREVPAVSANTRPRNRFSAPDTAIGRPFDDSGPSATLDPPHRTVYPPPRKVSRASARSPTDTWSSRPA